MNRSLLAICFLGLLFVSTGRAHAMKAGSFEISPFIAVTERYNDNVFATRDDTKGDFSTVISPGIQLLFPRVKRKYHLELRYQADIERFNRYSSENAVSHTVTGNFGILFPMGLELSVGDSFRRSHDPRGVSLGPELDFFYDNNLHFSAAYVLTDRFKVQLDYSHHILNYDAERNNFRNYAGDLFAAYLYYRFKPKTSAFVEYEYAIVHFNESEPLNLDSSEHHFFAGITWAVTEKTKGMIKAGYGVKDFNDSSTNGNGFGGFIIEAAIAHELTTRDLINLTASRATNETNMQGDAFFVTTSVFAEYSHRITGKITGRVNIGYATDSYKSEFPQFFPPRTDKIWTAGAGLSYQFKKWLLTEAGYSYTKRSSSVDDFNYSNNTVFLRVVGTL